MIFEYKYKPVIEDFNKYGILTYNAVVKIFENAGNAHSDLAGDSVYNIKDLSRAWVLTDWQIQMEDFPVYGDEVMAQTWSEGFTSPLVANRNFLFYKNGKICGKATTRWILLDLASGRPSRIDPAYLEKYGTEDKTVFEDKKLIKIPAPENFTFEITIPVRRSDIDFNNHVHNLTYLDYAKEILPENIAEENFKSCRISYKTGLKPGSKALCKYAFAENSHVVYIYDENNTMACQIQFS